jgi:hypothetical protein
LLEPLTKYHELGFGGLPVTLMLATDDERPVTATSEYHG